VQDKELYQQILGLSSPWTVSEVQLDQQAQEVRVHVEHPRGAKFCCPECGTEYGVKNATVPWSEKGSRFTLMFEQFAIDVLLAAQTVKGAQSILRTSWDETWHILTKAVQRGMSAAFVKAAKANIPLAET